MFGRKLFNFTKSLIPKISQTELIALKSGIHLLIEIFYKVNFFYLKNQK